MSKIKRPKTWSIDGAEVIPMADAHCGLSEVAIIENGPHIMAVCPKCRQFVKFLSKREIAGLSPRNTQNGPEAPQIETSRQETIRFGIPLPCVYIATAADSGTADILGTSDDFHSLYREVRAIGRRCVVDTICEIPQKPVVIEANV